MVTLYIGIYVGHWGKANKTHTDLLDIPQKYLEREKCGFWVAILLDGNNPSPSSTSSSSSSSSSNIKHYAFVSEDKDANENDIENSLFPSNDNLIGTLAIDIKQGTEKGIYVPKHIFLILFSLSIKKPSITSIKSHF